MISNLHIYRRMADGIIQNYCIFNKKMPGRLYLIPNTLGSQDPGLFLPAALHSQITGLRCFVVENTRNARRYLKLIDRSVAIDGIQFFELNKHTSAEEISSFITPLLDGQDMGLISEAGLPGIADPGALLVRKAHEYKIPVIPFTGPSSITLALMASGLNGQCFRFQGYLPVKSRERIQAIKKLEQLAIQHDETQIFIETPYRNNALLEDLLTSCNAETYLCIARDLTTESEFIQTKSIQSWKKKKPELHKRPAIFLLGK